MRIRLLRLVLRCSCLFLIMTVTIITVSVYKHSRDHSTRASNLPSRPLHDIVEMKQYQQDYNSTAGPNTVQTLIKNQKSKKDRHSEEPVHVPLVHSNRDTTFQPLPLSVINRVKIYVFFVGVARSGHSIVGAILDSHPHIVISNELNVFRSLLNLPDITKSMLYNKIWNTSYEKAVKTGKLGMHSTDKGYSLAIDGLYQGMYDSYIDVIGDKMGGDTSVVYFTDPTEFEHRLNKLHSITNIPFKVFHVIRNPFDNIATIALYEHIKFQDNKIAVIKSINETLRLNPEHIYSAINYFFLRYQAAEDIKRRFNLDTMEIHNKDLIANPKMTIQSMCVFLDIFCSDEYLNTVNKKIFRDESRTRYNVVWTNDHILKVKENILKYDNLKQYLDFDF